MKNEILSTVLKDVGNKEIGENFWTILLRGTVLLNELVMLNKTKVQTIDTQQLNKLGVIN